MHSWAKLSSKLAESEQYADAANTDPVAGMLFLMALPQADLYGILPGDLRLFAGRVCPLLALTPKRIGKALDVLHEHGLIVRYEADGKQWLWLPGWHRHQDVRWSRIGPPDYPLPPEWTPPEELERACAQDADGERPLTRWFRRFCGDDAGQSGGVPETPGDSGSVPPRRRLDVDADADADKTSTTLAGSADAEPAPTDGLFADAPPGEQPRPDTPMQAAANACLAIWNLTHEHLDKQQKAAYYKAINKLIGDLEGGAEELLAWADGEGASTRTLGNGAKPERSIPAAVRKGVTAQSWQSAYSTSREKARTEGQRFVLRTDGRRVYERDWTREDRAWVDGLTKAGEWDTERGMRYADPRHPGQ